MINLAMAAKIPIGEKSTKNRVFGPHHFCLTLPF